MKPSAQAGRRSAAGAELHELGEYLDTAYRAPGPIPEAPLPDEPFTEWWRPRVEEGRTAGAYTVLERSFPQLHFPVRSGISRDPAYRAATRRGNLPAGSGAADGLRLARPEEVSLDLYPSLAGRIPVITVRHRPDFVTMVQALAKRNEPVPIPRAQGAAMVAGLPDWGRIGDLRRRWEERAAEDGAAVEPWASRWARIVERPAAFQSRFILLSDGPYSDVPASDLGLDDERWRRLSFLVRRDHECAHYFTRRVFGAMRNHLLDEIVADYVGLVAAIGRFRSDWFLRFLGLRGEATGRAGRRIEIYRGDPPLSEPAFAAVVEMVEKAADNLEAFDRARWPDREPSVRRRASMAAALSGLRLDELASSRADARLDRALAEAEEARRA